MAMICKDLERKRTSEELEGLSLVGDVKDKEAIIISDILVTGVLFLTQFFFKI
jgi:phosphoribosylpyrophosphate synthetase